MSRDKGTKKLEMKWGDRVYVDFFAHDLEVALKKALAFYRKVEAEK